MPEQLDQILHYVREVRADAITVAEFRNVLAAKFGMSVLPPALETMLRQEQRGTGGSFVVCLRTILYTTLNFVHDLCVTGRSTFVYLKCCSRI